MLEALEDKILETWMRIVLGICTEIILGSMDAERTSVGRMGTLGQLAMGQWAHGSMGPGPMAQPGMQQKNNAGENKSAGKKECWKNSGAPGRVLGETENQQT